MSNSTTLSILPPEDQKEDRISQLPEDVMLNFLSFLEMKDAAQTSILSQRWRDLWTYNWTNLDFDPSTIIPGFIHWFLCTPKDGHKYETWVNQVLSMHRGPCITKFRVIFGQHPSDSSDIDRWIRFAISKRVKELVLELRTAYRGIHVYTLGFDILKHPPCDVGISSLTSLDLCEVGVSDEFLEFILSRCCLLERLLVEGSHGIVRLKVNSCKLKHLKIWRCTNLQKLEIYALNLIKFEFQHIGLEQPHLVFKSVPSLVEAKFSGDCCEHPYPFLQLMSCFYMQLSKLSIVVMNHHDWLWEFPIRDIYPIPNVTHLELTVESLPIHSLLDLTRMVEACPSLCELRLRLLYYEYPKEEASILQEVDAQPESDHCRLTLLKDEKIEAHTKLKVLELIGFRGCPADVEFALGIVESTTCLERIVCDPVYRYGALLKVHVIEACRNRARKLAKIVGPKVKVIIL